MNVLKHFKKTTVLTLVQNGISQHEIARKTGVDRKTIRKYQALAPPQKSNSPMATGSAPLAPQGSGALRPTGFWETTLPPVRTTPTPVADNPTSAIRPEFQKYLR